MKIMRKSDGQPEAVRNILENGWPEVKLNLP